MSDSYSQVLKANEVKKEAKEIYKSGECVEDVAALMNKFIVIYDDPKEGMSALLELICQHASLDEFEGISWPWVVQEVKRISG